MLSASSAYLGVESVLAHDAESPFLFFLRRGTHVYSFSIVRCAEARVLAYADIVIDEQVTTSGGEGSEERKSAEA